MKAKEVWKEFKKRSGRHRSMVIMFERHYQGINASILRELAAFTNSRKMTGLRLFDETNEFYAKNQVDLIKYIRYSNTFCEDVTNYFILTASRYDIDITEREIIDTLYSSDTKQHNHDAVLLVINECLETLAFEFVGRIKFMEVEPEDITD